MYGRKESPKTNVQLSLALSLRQLLMGNEFLR